MARDPILFSTYEPSQIARILDVLDRASGGGPIDRGEVETSLLEIVHAVGLGMDGSEPRARSNDGTRP